MLWRFSSRVVLYINLFTTFDYVVNSSQSRSRRYVAFPEGSTVSVSISLALPTLSEAPRVFGAGVNWSIVYDLPNADDISNITKTVKHRRQRRELYQKLETVINLFGFDGRSCIYRALCEAEEKLKGNNLIEELLRIMLRFPLDGIYDSEPELHRLYHRARRMGGMNYDCIQMFSGCETSLIDLALIPFE